MNKLRQPPDKFGDLFWTMSNTYDADFLLSNLHDGCLTGPRYDSEIYQYFSLNKNILLEIASFDLAPTMLKKLNLQS